MNNITLGDSELAAYGDVFPQSQNGVIALNLTEKVGKAKKGSYLLLEYYCVLEECDCRHAVLFAFNSKEQQVAVINVPLDTGPLLRPYLADEFKQSSSAEGLLEVLIEALNEHPEYHHGMCRRYRAVSKKIDGVSYQGEPFPKLAQGGLLPSNLSEDFNREFGSFLGSGKSRTSKNIPDSSQPSLFNEAFDDDELSLFEAVVESYRLCDGKDYDKQTELKIGLRICLYDKGFASDELVEYLCCLWYGDDEEGIEVLLQMLADALEILRVDLERKRSEAELKMQELQKALAEHIFIAGADYDLAAAVTGVLLDARIEILPELHEANSRRLAEEVDDMDITAASPEQEMIKFLDHLDEAGIESSFELVDALLQTGVVGDIEPQITIVSYLFHAESELAREAAVLMLFHPIEAVRQGVADFLVQADGKMFSPQALRRLIVSRNWFAKDLQRQVDRMIAHARKAGVECAPLRKRGKRTVRASTHDGAGAQSIFVVLPLGEGYSCCSLMFKKGHGVADAYVTSLPNKREFNRLRKMMRHEVGATEVDPAYLDMRLCQALSDGVKHGKIPGHWLVAIAEQTGSDQWKAVDLDVERDLQMLSEELKAQGAELLSKRARQRALKNSSTWVEQKTFAMSWFEDDVTVDKQLEYLLETDEQGDSMQPILGILDHVLEPRREIWLERLVVTTAWLKASRKPPAPWQEMLHVALMVADKSVPLQDIPLMIAVAEHSVAAFLGRNLESDGIPF